MATFTSEQLAAIERRNGDLLLDASAGSGKTSVLVERFVRAVLQDGVDVRSILTITFTEKAAAELRDRIRRRLREAGADDAARATEGAFISTIHGFCSRVLRGHALAAGIDPGFSVLDQPQARRLADLAFERALDDLARDHAGAVELIAAYTPGGLREGICAVHDELRARGERHPRLPALAPPPEPEPLREALRQAAAAAAAELGAVENPPVRVRGALERLEQCHEILAAADPSPARLGDAALPGGNGSKLASPVCLAYCEALERFRQTCRHRRAQAAHGVLDALLVRFGALYEQFKHAASGIDFEDLELLARALLREDSELGERFRERFRYVMVDELQDTNRVQLELIEAVAIGNLFTVGDAQQSIYGFRHADLELFERLGEQRAAAGERATLTVNFRTRPDLIAVLNRAFAAALGPCFRPLQPGRNDPPAAEPVVELLVADKIGSRTSDGLAAPWRLAEAGALARRVRELVDTGTAPRDVVVLTRATTDLRAYERALEDLGVPTYVIGGRGYWSHPQVVDLIGYLRGLANPRDEEALYTLLASPLVGLSLDGLVELAAAAHAAELDPWWLLRKPEGRLERLGEADTERLQRFLGWFVAERDRVARTAIQELIDRALVLSGYDLTILALPGGQRRLANVRKLMRLGREHEAAVGPDLRGFLDLVYPRDGAADAGGAALDPRESEAPVEGEALDAVRMMTIHRAKGLEFKIVCVADLGRVPVNGSELLRVGRDGRFGLRLSDPGTGHREPALDYEELGAEQQRLDREEERRLFYVAMTRAQERLILSGAAKLEPWSGGSAPIGWIGPAFVPDIAERAGEGVSITENGIRFSVFRAENDGGGADAPVPSPVRSAPVPSSAVPSAPVPPSAVPSASMPPSAVPSAPVPPPVPTSLSYSALSAYRRCGYRFYVERVLGVPAISTQSPASSSRAGSGPVQASIDVGEAEPGGLGASDRGLLAHAALERLDFRRPAVVSVETLIAAVGPAPGSRETAEIERMIRRFAQTELCARLARAGRVRREERFAFLLASGVLMNGTFDVLAEEEPGGMLVVDYKTDRLHGGDPEAAVQRAYTDQQQIYALAALRAGARTVEVAHVFLEAPEQPVSVSFVPADAQLLEGELERLVAGVLQRRFPVSQEPQRSLCAGCPAEGGLCSWSLELTRRESPERLF